MMNLHIPEQSEVGTAMNFSFEGHAIRVVIDERGEPLFVGKDICDVLGYANHNKAMGDHCKGVTIRYPIPDPLGRPQATRVLTEGDMFRLVVNSTLPAAEAFERMVFDEILPTIRRTGGYLAKANPDQLAVPQTLPEALRLAAQAIEQRDRLAIANAANEEALKEAAPKVKALELITAGEKSITIRESAKLLGIKEERLTTWLHANGWVYRLNKRWVAKQEHIIGGRLVYKEGRYTDQQTGHEAYAPYCHITPKGLAKLAKVFGAEQPGMAA